MVSWQVFSLLLIVSSECRGSDLGGVGSRPLKHQLRIWLVMVVVVGGGGAPESFRMCVCVCVCEMRHFYLGDRDLASAFHRFVKTCIWTMALSSWKLNKTWLTHRRHQLLLATILSKSPCVVARTRASISSKHVAFFFSYLRPRGSIHPGRPRPTTTKKFNCSHFWRISSVYQNSGHERWTHELGVGHGCSSFLPVFVFFFFFLYFISFFRAVDNKCQMQP